MKKTRAHLSKPATEFRPQAEARLQAQPQTPPSEADAARLLHELQVHQVELELQNQQLMQARDDVEAGLERYTDLYDFAPVGYFTLDDGGLIQTVNLTGADLLARERARLIGRLFLPFVAEPDRRAFTAFLRLTWASKTRQRCDLALLKADAQPLAARLEAIVSHDGRECRMAVTDITELKQAALECERMIAALQQALAEVKTLKSLIPICASCKKIRNDGGFWEQVETYIQQHSEATFSHGLCPACTQKMYPELEGELDLTTDSAALVPSAPAPRSGRSILLVVTDHATRAANRRALEGGGFTVAAVGNGMEATEALTARPGEFGLVVMEQAMPLMDGLVTLHTLRCLKHDLQVVFLTDAADPALPPDLRPNVRACLAKPFTNEQLLAAVKQAVALPDSSPAS